MQAPEGRSSLREIAGLFLKLGTTAFGGPAAHIAMMEEEVVRRRGWVSREEFLDLLAAAQLVPGPNSTELAIHLGLRRAGWPGFWVAGACFILPAAVIVGAIAEAYVRFGALPVTTGLLAGVKPVVLAVVGQAVWEMGKTGLKTRRTQVIAAAVFALSLLGASELVLLLAAGVAAIGPGAVRAAFLPTLAAAGAPVAFGLWPLFGVFLKIGAVLYGSGYVLLAFLQAELVDRLGWLSAPQLLDAVAVGQVTPGPVFTTATFIGYLLAGPAGAAVATVGIFLPAFLFVAVSGPLVPRLRANPTAGAFLDGVIAGSLALMAAVLIPLGQAAVSAWWAAGLAIASLVLLVRFKVNATWLVVGGAAIGVVLGL